MKNKFILLTVILFVLMGSFSPVAYGQVTDVGGHWAGPVINQWVEKALAKGYDDGTFRPNNDISRAEFMVLVNGVFDYSKEADIDYKDVDSSKWYVETIKKAKAAGYISGYDDGTMRPENSISREEVATIIFRIMGLKEDAKGVEAFKDQEKMKWSRSYVGAVSKAGYMIGFLDGEFKPLNNITRAESLYALNNILMAKEGPDEIKVVAKEDFFGVTHIYVTWSKGVQATSVKANGIELKYSSEDRKWKGSSMELKKGDSLEIIGLEDGKEVKVKALVKDMLDD